jgi:hypothetical protein
VPKFEVSIPAGVAYWMGWASELVDWLKGSEGPLTRGSIKDATQTEYVSIGKARRILGYNPRVRLPEAVKISCQVREIMQVSTPVVELMNAAHFVGIESRDDRDKYHMNV